MCDKDNIMIYEAEIESEDIVLHNTQYKLKQMEQVLRRVGDAVTFTRFNHIIIS